MRINPDYDLSKPLQSALRSKAPYVGVPIPGHAPLIFKRSRLQGVLKGVTPTSIECTGFRETETRIIGGLKWEVEGWSQTRWLIIRGTASEGRVKTCVKMLSMRRSEFHGRTDAGKEMERWREATIKEYRKPKPTFSTDRKTAAAQRKAVAVLAKLERAKEKIFIPAKPNPVVPTIHKPYAVESFKTMRETKRFRTIIGALSKQAVRDNWSTKKLYDAMERRGWKFVRWSEITSTQREHKGLFGIADYLRKLDRFVVGSGTYDCFSKWHGNLHYTRKQQFVPQDDYWGAERYYPYLAARNELRSIQHQIDSINAMLKPTVEEQIAA